MLFFFLLGCSLLGIHIPPKWNFESVQQQGSSNFCATGTVKVRGNLKSAINAARHQANIKLVPVYTEQAYGFSEYLDDETGFDLNVVHIERIHGHNKSPLYALQKEIFLSPNTSKPKKIWVMQCFDSDTTQLKDTVSKIWLKNYHEKYPKQESETTTEVTKEDTEGHNEAQALAVAETISIEEKIHRLIEKYKDE